VPRGYGGARSFWISDDNYPGCGGFPQAFRYFDGATYTIGCAKDWHKEPVVCVHNAGLYPAAPPKLYPAGGF
jgi:hypothetical protein